MSEQFPLDVSDSEATYGFDVTEAPTTGGRAVVADLGAGLRAVKIRRTDGDIEYVVTDSRLQPLYTVARSIDELRARFPR
jgi:hypothetical protein